MSSRAQGSQRWQAPAENIWRARCVWLQHAGGHHAGRHHHRGLFPSGRLRVHEWIPGVGRVAGRGLHLVVPVPLGPRGAPVRQPGQGCVHIRRDIVQVLLHSVSFHAGNVRAVVILGRGARVLEAWAQMPLWRPEGLRARLLGPGSVGTQCVAPDWCRCGRCVGAFIQQDVGYAVHSGVLELCRPFGAVLRCATVLKPLLLQECSVWRVGSPEKRAVDVRDCQFQVVDVSVDVVSLYLQKNAERLLVWYHVFSPGFH